MNIMGVVMDKQRDDLYKFNTKNGILKSLDSRSQWERTRFNFITCADVPVEETVSLKRAATSAAMGGGQGYIRCHCRTKCRTNCCLCRKNMLFNSICHDDIPTCTIHT